MCLCVCADSLLTALWRPLWWCPCPPLPAEQLKTVMAQVLDFALRELTKIVEASFDDLLLEVTKMETEQQGLEERLGRSSGRVKGSGARRRGSENDSVSPSDSEDAAAKEAEDAAGGSILEWMLPTLYFYLQCW